MATSLIFVVKITQELATIDWSQSDQFEVGNNSIDCVESSPTSKIELF